MRKPIIVLLFVFLLTASAKGDYDNGLYFIQQLSTYAQDYYNSVSQNPTAAMNSFINKSKNLLITCGLSKSEVSGIGDLENLQDSINQLLITHNHKILLFYIPKSEIINVWLGEFTEENNLTKEIFGRMINFKVISLDNLKIHDYLYFSTDGREMIDAGARDNIIYYNLEALYKKAQNIWDFFQNRKKGNFSKRYAPSKFDRLRKHIQHKAWQDFYEGANKKNKNAQEARLYFIDKAVELIKENSLAHELAHLFIKNNSFKLEVNREEEFAFLFEFSYGKIPFETLDTIIGIYAKGLKDIYSRATEDILNGFLEHIQKQQLSASPEYKRILINGNLLRERARYLYLLEEEQIRGIAFMLLDNFYERKL